MAEHPDVDLLVVSVRTAGHVPLVEAALGAGKHVFCEWPLGGSGEIARTLASAAAAAGVRTMVDLQSYGQAVFRYVRDLIGDGFLGRVVSINWHCWQENFGPSGLSSHAYVADAAHNADLLRIATGHTLSALDCCLGPFRALDATMATQYPSFHLQDTDENIVKTSPDQIVIGGTLENGAVASIHMLGGATRTAGTRLEISGTEGDFLLTSTGAANVNRAAYELRGGRGDRMDVMRVPASYAIEPAGLPEGPPLAVAHLYTDFARALRGQPAEVPDFHTAARIHDVLDAIVRASAEGRRQWLS